LGQPKGVMKVLHKLESSSWAKKKQKKGKKKTESSIGSGWSKPG